MSLHADGLSTRRTPRVWVPGVLGVLTFPLGLVGFWQYEHIHGLHGTILDWGYHTLQLFILHGVHLHHPIPWTLHLARYLAPAATLYGMYQLAVLAFQEPFRAIRLRYARRHVVIVGDGPLARQIATTFCTRGHTVVTVGAQEPDWVTASRLRGRYLHVPSDAPAMPPFGTLRVFHSAQVILAGQDDPANVAAAVRLAEWFAGQRAPAPRPPCHVHLFDLPMRQMFARHRLFEGPAGAVRLSLFNVYDNCARDLLQQFPLDHIPIKAGATRAVRLVVVGFGKMGESLTLHAAKLGHFANGSALEIMVFDREASERRMTFLHRYRHFRKVCAIKFRPQDVRHPTAVRELADLLKDPSRVQMLVLCLNNESLNVSLALDLFEDLRRSNVPALVRMSAEDGLARLLTTTADAMPFAQVLHPFAVLGSAVATQLLETPARDRLARTIHEDFRDRRRREGRRADDPSMQPWETLRPDFQESNRRQADHIPAKLRAIGCSIQDMDGGREGLLRPFQDFDPQEIDLLARMEHASWNAERFLAGWDLGERNEPARTNPYLLPWEELPTEAQEWDREAVRNIPYLLQKVGKTISR